MNTFEIKKGYFRVYDGKTAYPLYVDEHRDFSHLDEPEYIYHRCQDIGLDESRTIDVMLKTLHRRRVFKGDWLGELDLCIELIGPRGSGKSVGLTGIAVLDGLLAGRRVVSNMPIELKVKYKDCEKVFQSDDLDAALLLDINEFNENYYNCMVCVDEVNVYLADAQRSTSNQALFTSHILQQMRHRQLDFLFTTQNEMWNTKRIQFQVDFYIRCRDAAMLSGKPRKEDIGRKSQWELYDMSGLVTGEVMHVDWRSFRVPPYDTKTFWNVPFWGCYSTAMIQRHDKYINKQETGRTIGLDPDRLKLLAEQVKGPMDLILNVVNRGFDRIEKSKLWEILDIENDHGMQTKVGSILTKLGCVTIDSTNSREYLLPTQAEMVKHLNKLGLDVKTTWEENYGESEG